MATTTEPPYSVTYWGSHPEAGNDDCWYGDEYESRDEAEAAYAAPVRVGPHQIPDPDTMYVMLEGPDVHRIRLNPEHRPTTTNDDDREWKREMAMQAGMEFGIDGYNDMMGY